MRLADQLKPVRRNVCYRDAAARVDGIRAPQARLPPAWQRPSPAWSSAQERGELGFDRWLAYLSVTGRTFAARYWSEQGYVLANSPFPLVIASPASNRSNESRR